MPDAVATLEPPRPRAGERWQACVVGAGPAGALAAQRLASSGVAVLLVDKARFPRPKLCGGCLGGDGLATLDAAGLSLASLGVPATPLTRLTIRCGPRAVSLPLGRRVALARDRFDAALVEAAFRSGVETRFGWRAAVGDARGGVRCVRLARGDQTTEIRADLVLVAAGLGGAAAAGVGEIAARRRVKRGNRVGVGLIVDDATPNYRRGEVTMVSGQHGEGYVGLARLPDGRLDVAAALAPAALRDAGGAAGAITRLLDHAGLPTPGGVEHGAIDAVPSLTQRPTRLAAERLLLVGDAAGYVEPFTGEGMGWAMRSALAAAPIARDAVAEWTPAIERRWRSAHAQSTGWRRRRCRLLCDLIGGRRATGVVVRVLQAAPWLASPVLRAIDGAAPAAREPAISEGTNEERHGV